MAITRATNSTIELRFNKSPSSSTPLLASCLSRQYISNPFAEPLRKENSFAQPLSCNPSCNLLHATLHATSSRRTAQPASCNLSHATLHATSFMQPISAQKSFTQPLWVRKGTDSRNTFADLIFAGVSAWWSHPKKYL